MGPANPVAVRVETPEYGRVIVQASDGKRYHANLAVFPPVYCYPKNAEEWGEVSPDTQGLALVWTSRFEVHVDQVIALADRVESTLRSA